MISKHIAGHLVLTARYVLSDRQTCVRCISRPGRHHWLRIFRHLIRDPIPYRVSIQRSETIHWIGSPKTGLIMCLDYVDVIIVTIIA